MTTVYHYTNADGLRGILDDAAIRASHWAYLNDVQEGLHAAMPLIARLEAEFEARTGDRDVGDLRVHPNFPGEGPAPDDEDYRTAWLHGMAEQMRTFLVGSEQRLSWDAYCVSFARQRDELSLWRGYAGPSGFAIGFSREALEASVASFSDGEPGWGHIGSRWGDRGAVVDIRYGDQASLDFAEQTITNILGLTFGPYLPKTIWIDLGGNLLPALLTMKNAAFEAELETRMVQASNGGFSESPPRFRTSKGMFIPYREFAFERTAVVEVVIGPGGDPERRRANLSRYLRATGYGDAVVSVSEVPFAPE